MNHLPTLLPVSAAIALTIIAFLTLPGKDLAVIPCIVGQMSQLFIDSIFVGRWAAQAAAEAAAEAQRATVQESPSPTVTDAVEKAQCADKSLGDPRPESDVHVLELRVSLEVINGSSRPNPGPGPSANSKFSASAAHAAAAAYDIQT